MNEASNIPKFAFSPTAEETEKTPPIRRQIGKTMEITENFTLYGVFSYLAQVEKEIQKFKDSIVALEGQKKNYQDEIKLIEEALGVSNLEQDFQSMVAAEAVVKEAMEKQLPKK